MKPTITVKYTDLNRHSSARTWVGQAVIYIEGLEDDDVAEALHHIVLFIQNMERFVEKQQNKKRGT